MIDQDTVFILGAGASHPYGYPTGKELREYIYENFNNELPHLFNSSASPGRISVLKTQAEQFTKAFKKSSTSSIDLFLSRNQEFSQIGRIAIISSILNYEYQSKFWEDIKALNQAWNTKNQDWYFFLFERMTRTLIKGDSYKKFGENKVTFLTFNYDRSLEHFLYESLRNSFRGRGTPEADIIAEVNKIPIHHLYGKIVDLPWQNNHEGLEYLSPEGGKFFGRFEFDKLQEWSANIRIVHDGTPSNSPDYKSIIEKAKRVFYLGFGFAPENLEIIKPNKSPIKSQEVYGTALGFTDKEVNNIAKVVFPSYLNGHPTHKIEKKMDCRDLLREYL